MKWFAAVLLGLLGPVSALSAVQRVPGDHPTIQAAVDAAAPGDTVWIAPGSYTENVSIKFKDGLALIGAEGWEKTIIDGDAKNSVVYADSNSGTLVFSGLTFKGGDAQLNGGGLAVRKTATLVRACRFVGNRAYNSGGGLSLLNCPSNIVENCMFEQNECLDEASAASIVGGRGVFSGNTVRDNTGAIAVVLIQSGCDLRNNVIVRNLCTDFGAIAYQFAFNAVIEENTIAQNTGMEGMGAIIAQLGDLRIERNIICHNKGVAGIYIESADGLVRHGGNNIWKNEGGLYVGTEAGPGDLAVDPMFCNPDKGDYRLRKKSPCLPTEKRPQKIGALGEGCP
ncbi:MAG: right-handed parallel beta-helix repeat-containing protein [Candidatus Eisenbacteria bacterium]|nr:right-handed parallel beta-helix repeat-containing protein [Candidatus Eisenbacteria bacterium]